MIQAIATGKGQPLLVLLVTRRVQESDMCNLFHIKVFYVLHYHTLY